MIYIFQLPTDEDIRRATQEVASTSSAPVLADPFHTVSGE